MTDRTKDQRVDHRMVELTGIYARVETMKTRFDSHIHQEFIDFDGAPPQLSEAIRYPLLAGGKRIRPVMAMLAAEALGHQADSMLPLATGIECLHTYSLVHDDLPCLDNDDLRRGRPTTHKVFGEDIAVLVGDALLTESFRLIAAEQQCATPQARVELVAAFAHAVGHRGMIAGQFLDIVPSETADLAYVENVHALKTGALFAFSASAPAIAMAADAASRDALREYGSAMGLLFQITDDIIDEVATAEQLGKTPGKDAAQGKSTYIKLMGLEGARTEAARVASVARAALDGMSGGAASSSSGSALAAKQDLSELVGLVLGRLS